MEAKFEVMDWDAAPASYFEEDGYSINRLKTYNETREYSIQESEGEDAYCVSYSQKIREYEVKNDEGKILYLYELTGDQEAENFITAEPIPSVEEALGNVFSMIEESLVSANYNVSPAQ